MHCCEGACACGARCSTQEATIGVQVMCDNSAVVVAVNLGRARDPRLMRLLHCLHFWAAVDNVTMTCSHIQGSSSCIADAISHNNLSLFHSLVPQAPSQLMLVPAALRQLLLGRPVEWTSVYWMKLFCTSLNKVSHCQQPAPTAHVLGDTPTSVLN